MTGTDSAKNAVPDAVTGGIGIHHSARLYTLGIVGGTSVTAHETQEERGQRFFALASIDLHN
jgi:hypothetical protein